MIGIYVIRNIINDKCYYGSAKNIKRRWTKHKSQLKYNRHENVILQRAWNKYGEENFMFEIVEKCCENELLTIEQKYLDLEPEYNIAKQASGGDNLTNHPNRDDIIKRISKTITNNIGSMTEEMKKKNWSRPKEQNPNWKGGISVKYCSCGKQIEPHHKNCNKCRPRNGENNPFYNKKHSEETKKHLSEIKMGKYYGSQNIKINIDGIEYFSLSEASGKLNIPVTTIRWRVKSNNKKFKDYSYETN